MKKAALAKIKKELLNIKHNNQVFVITEELEDGRISLTHNDETSYFDTLEAAKTFINELEKLYVITWLKIIKIKPKRP